MIYNLRLTKTGHPITKLQKLHRLDVGDGEGKRYTNAKRSSFCRYCNRREGCATSYQMRHIITKGQEKKKGQETSRTELRKLGKKRNRIHDGSQCVHYQCPTAEQVDTTKS
ncbi:hypothetical protein AcW2_000873 [Taiwanofungus camphoratus]|nr:hypothetical protein AcW2_000873 [Antrodia cinnamomea]